MKRQEFKNLIRRELIKEAKGTSYEAKLRKNIKLLMSATDSAGLDETANRLKTVRTLTNKGNVTKIIEEAEVIEETNDEIPVISPEVIVNAYADSESIPDSIIKSIATKILVGV